MLTTTTKPTRVGNADFRRESNWIILDLVTVQTSYRYHQKNRFLKINKPFFLICKILPIKQVISLHATMIGLLDTTIKNPLTVDRDNVVSPKSVLLKFTFFLQLSFFQKCSFVAISKLFVVLLKISAIQRLVI